MGKAAVSDMRGYVKVHRKIMVSEIWDNDRELRLALTVLILARWGDGESLQTLGPGVRVRRGELVTTLRNLSNKTKVLSVQQIRTGLTRLKSIGFLTHESTKTFTRIRVVKYGRYQDKPGLGQHSSQQTINTRSTHDRVPYKESLKKVKKPTPRSAAKRPAAPAGRTPSGASNGHGIKGDPKAIERVLSAYLRLAKISQTQAAGDSRLRADWARQARRLLSRLGGRADLAVECLQERARQWASLDWTLGGVAAKAGDWLARKQAGAR